MTDTPRAAQDDGEAPDDSRDVAPDRTRARVRTRRSRKTLLFVRDIVFILLAAILISFLVKTFLFRSFYIPSESMQNTLQVNDRIIVNELVPDVVGLQHGDVIVFRDPGNWVGAGEPDTRNAAQKGLDSALEFVGLAAPNGDEHLVKRVIGLPGDTVACCDGAGALTVNGVPLDEPYIETGANTMAAPGAFELAVPEGSLWVMGDNRYNSRDSLAHYREGDPRQGFVPMDDVVGRAFVVSWPAARWSWLGNYPDAFLGVDAD